MSPKRALEPEVYDMSSQAKDGYFEILFKPYKEFPHREKTMIIDECWVIRVDPRKDAIGRYPGRSREISVFLSTFIYLDGRRIHPRFTRFKEKPAISFLDLSSCTRRLNAPYSFLERICRALIPLKQDVC